MNAPERLSETPGPEQTPLRRKILLVEGEEDQAIYWSAVLASLGFEVLTATSLSSARAMIASASPSIVACSSCLADGSGIEFLGQLRADPELALVYLVLLTTSVGQEEVIASLRGGANDCIDMGASYGEIRARLELAERVISLNEALQQKSAALGEALRKIQSELQAAALLQAAMLPKALDCREFQLRTFYRPSDLLGGDMLGLTVVGDDRIAFGLIDVVGHGTASALISCSLIREMMDGMVSSLQATDARMERECPKVVIEEMNRRYCRLNIPGMYFTALAGVLDTSSGRVTYCQAGHPNLLRLQSATGWRERQDSGYPVGLIETAEYTLNETQLAPGEMLLAVSDGLLRPSATDPGGGLGLLNCLPRAPRQPQEVIVQLERLAARAEGFEQDDQSAMLICCSPG